MNLKGGNMISHPRNLETNESSETNIGHNEIFMIKIIIYKKKSRKFISHLK